MSTWTWNSGYSLAWMPTEDPRVVAVIVRDEEPGAPYGDALAPAYWLDYPHDPRRAGEVFHDDESDELATIWQNVHAYAVNGQYSKLPSGRRALRDYDTFTARFMRIFHGVRAFEINHREGSVLILDTPNYRAHVGRPTPDPTAAWDDAEFWEGEASEWRAYLDGDVYGVGFATMPERVTDETPISDDLDGWDVEVQCWGFAGQEYAMEEAATMEHGAPELPAMLPLGVPA